MKATLTETEQLKLIADLAHSSGLLGYDEGTTLTAIRLLTIALWEPYGTMLEHKQRVMKAIKHAKE